MRLLLPSALLLIALQADAQGLWSDAAARALGGAGAALGQSGPFAVNPASDGGPTLVAIGSSRLYGTGVLNPYRLGASFPAGSFRGAVSVAGLGMEGFRRQRLTVALGVPLNRVTVAVRGGVTRQRAGPYPVRMGLLLDVGLLLGARSRLSGALVLRRESPLSQTADTRHALRVAVAWKAADRIRIPVDIERVGPYPLSTLVGAEVDLDNGLIVRLGASTMPDRTAVGVRMVAEPLEVDVAIERHPALGLSFAADLRMRWD